MRKEAKEEYKKSEGWLLVYLTITAISIPFYLSGWSFDVSSSIISFGGLHIDINPIIGIILLFVFCLLVFTRKKFALQFTKIILLLSILSSVFTFFFGCRAFSISIDEYCGEQRIGSIAVLIINLLWYNYFRISERVKRIYAN